MKVAKAQGHLASTLSLFILLSRTCAERDGILGSVIQHQSSLKRELWSPREDLSSNSTTIDTETFLSRVEERHSQTGIYSKDPIAKMTTSCRGIQTLRFV